MIWGLLVVAALFVGFGRASLRRHERDPLVMPFRSGHIGYLGEAPIPCHHRLGARRG